VSETPEQLRTIGWRVLVGGLILAVVVYWMRARAGPAPGAALFAPSRSSDNQIGRMMGHFGLMMMDWQAWLATPAAYGLGVAVLSALFAGYFFRVASVTEEENRERDGGA
jgi:hypothetical protein